MRNAFVIGAVLALGCWQAQSNELNLHGIDKKGRPCSAKLWSSREGTLFNVMVGRYEFDGLILKAEDNGYSFSSLTVDYGSRRYGRLKGSPIAVGNIGMLDVIGRILVDGTGTFDRIEFSATGGLFNWWSRTFTCTSLSVLGQPPKLDPHLDLEN